MTVSVKSEHNGGAPDVGVQVETVISRCLIVFVGERGGAHRILGCDWVSYLYRWGSPRREKLKSSVVVIV